MKDNTYNGWSNYATWRINLEYGFNDTEEFADYDYKDLQSYVEEHLETECDNQTTLGYAMAFIEDVNWYEIASHL